ncbi:hypothetical protein T484DRAFT_1882610, partial [Baffinella frigidus]
MGLSRPAAAEVLSVPSTASDGGIRHAYVHLALASHPRAGGDALAFRKACEAYMRMCPDCRDLRTDDEEEEEGDEGYGEGELADVFNAAAAEEHHALRPLYAATPLASLFKRGNEGRDWVAFFTDFLPRLASLRANGDEYDSPDSGAASPRRADPRPEVPRHEARSAATHAPVTSAAKEVHSAATKVPVARAAKETAGDAARRAEEMSSKLIDEEEREKQREKAKANAKGKAKGAKPKKAVSGAEAAPTANGG